MDGAIRRLVPPLSYGARKGQMGRVGVLGGSADFTGAPYYAGMASLKESLWGLTWFECIMAWRSSVVVVVLWSHASNLTPHPLPTLTKTK